MKKIEIEVDDDTYSRVLAYQQFCGINDNRYLSNIVKDLMNTLFENVANNMIDEDAIELYELYNEFKRQNILDDLDTLGELERRKPKDDEKLEY